MIKLLKENKRGMTLLEVVVATAIVAVLTTALGQSFFAVLRNSESNNGHMLAATGIQNAAHRLGSDGQMAQNTDLVPGAAAVASLNLNWIDPVTGDSYEVDYFLSGNELRRRESMNGEEQNTRTVARFITGILFSQPLGDERLFTVSIASSGGSVRVRETRKYHVTLRAVD